MKRFRSGSQTSRPGRKRGVGRRGAFALGLAALFAVGLLTATGAFGEVGTLTGTTSESAPAATDTTSPDTGPAATTTTDADGASATTLTPSITSDQPDYNPGSTVTLAGADWAPYETVHVLVNDDFGQTWSYATDVTADIAGGFTAQFQLPDWFVANYSVTATGSSGRSAATSFTDGNVNVKTAGVSSAPVDWQRFSNTTCSGSPADSGSVTATSGGNGTSIAGGATSAQSLRLSAGAVSGLAFSSWSGGNVPSPGTANPICVPGQNPTQQITLTYVAGDTTPPDTSITNNPQNPSNVATASFAFTGSDNVTPAASLTFECSIDNAAFASCTSPKGYSGLTDGSHTFQVRAKDAAGNVDQSPASFTWLVDTAAPASSGSAKNADNSTYAFGTWTNQNVSVTLSGSDTGGSNLKEIRYTLDGTTPTSSVGTVYGAPFAVSTLGTTTLKWRAIDNAGNMESVHTESIQIDKAAPASSILCDGAACGSGFYDADVTVSLSATDTGGSDVKEIRYTTDNSTPTASSNVYVSPFTVSATTTVKFRAFDNAGNAEAANSQTIQIDKTDPSVAAHVSGTLGNDGWYTSDVTVSFVYADPESGVASTSPDCAGTTITSDQAATTYTCTVTNGAGSSAFASATVKRDATAPVITDLGPTSDPNGAGWYDHDVTNRFEASDALSGLAADCLAAFPDVSGDRVQSQTTSGEGTAITVESDSCTDVAGNVAAAVTSAKFMVDETAPAITDLGATSTPNAAGWFNHDVTDRFKATDALSGLNATCLTAFPDASGDRVQSQTTFGEGSSVTVSSDPCTDVAGNTAAGKSSAAFKVDETKPTITDLGPTTSPNGAGWFNHDVTNRFKAEDALSGLDAACSTAYPNASVQSQTTSGEGTAVTVDSDPCTDVAGNTATAVTSAGFKVDETKPTITDLGPTSSPNGAGWFNHDVTNQFKAEDALSGLDAACLTAFPDVSGDRVQSQTTSGEGTSVTVNSDPCTDVAGNTAAAQSSAAFKVDETKPTITDLGPTTSPNGAGWYNDDVTNGFKAEDALSGLDATCSTAYPNASVQSKTTSGEGAAVTVASDPCTDGAGNTAAATSSAGFKIDETPPGITFAGQTPAKNADGWNNSDVTLSWTCSDSLSGPVTTPVTKTVTSEGADQQRTGTCDDVAGNSTSSTDGDVDLDKTKPALAVTGAADGATYTLGSVPATGCATSDALSGVKTNATLQALTGSGTTNANGVGSFTATCSGAADKAGNTGSASVTYSVIYGNLVGFLQPINFTAHDIGTNPDVSTFKAGSTVPVKVQIKAADGTIVKPVSALWITPQQGSATSQAVDEALFSDPATSGTAYVWQGTFSQFNWGTPKSGAGSYWLIGVKLDDGQTYKVYISLR